MRRSGMHPCRSRALIACLMAAMMLAACQRSGGGPSRRDDAQEPPWAAHIRALDAAVALRDVSAAERAWHRAYGAALGSRGWEGMLEVGDAYLRIGNLTGDHGAAAEKARAAYLSALFRARQQASVDGVLRAAEAFAALGDREVAERGVRTAERLAMTLGDLQLQTHARSVRTRLAVRPASPNLSSSGP